MSRSPSHYRVRVRNLNDLRRGDQVEAMIRSVVHHRGKVLDLAPGLGAVWIRSDAGRRALIHTDEYRLWQVLPAEAG